MIELIDGATNVLMATTIIILLFRMNRERIEDRQAQDRIEDALDFIVANMVFASDDPDDEVGGPIEVEYLSGSIELDLGEDPEEEESDTISRVRELRRKLDARDEDNPWWTA